MKTSEVFMSNFRLDWLETSGEAYRFTSTKHTPESTWRSQKIRKYNYTFMQYGEAFSGPLRQQIQLQIKAYLDINHFNFRNWLKHTNTRFSWEWILWWIIGLGYRQKTGGVFNKKFVFEKGSIEIKRLNTLDRFPLFFQIEITFVTSWFYFFLYNSINYRRERFRLKPKYSFLLEQTNFDNNIDRGIHLAMAPVFLTVEQHLCKLPVNIAGAPFEFSIVKVI